MSDLYPTPTRLQFLRDITNGLVFVDPYGQASLDAEPDGVWRRVTSRWADVHRAGWARRPEGDKRWQRAELTEAGMAVLAKARR